MFEGISMFLENLGGFLSLKILFDVLWSTQLGIIVGMLPGLTATMGVALMTTLTYKMSADNAVLILMCMYIGAIYGGSRSAILLNIPGTPANAATSVDGHPLATAGPCGRGHRHRYNRKLSRFGYRYVYAGPVHSHPGELRIWTSSLSSSSGWPSSVLSFPVT